MKVFVVVGFNLDKVLNNFLNFFKLLCLWVIDVRFVIIFIFVMYCIFVLFFMCLCCLLFFFVLIIVFIFVRNINKLILTSNMIYIFAIVCKCLNICLNVCMVIIFICLCVLMVICIVVIFVGKLFLCEIELVSACKVETSRIAYFSFFLKFNSWCSVL